MYEMQGECLAWRGETQGQLFNPLAKTVGISNKQSETRSDDPPFPRGFRLAILGCSSGLSLPDSLGCAEVRADSLLEIEAQLTLDHATNLLDERHSLHWRVPGEPERVLENGQRWRKLAVSWLVRECLRQCYKITAISNLKGSDLANFGLPASEMIGGGKTAVASQTQKPRMDLKYLIAGYNRDIHIELKSLTVKVSTCTPCAVMSKNAKPGLKLQYQFHKAPSFTNIQSAIAELRHFTEHEAWWSCENIHHEDPPDTFVSQLDVEDSTLFDLGSSTSTIKYCEDPNHYASIQRVLARSSLDSQQIMLPACEAYPVSRIWRSIRMRVRYTCHECKTAIGYLMKCDGCQHQRCYRCDRYPPRRPKPAYSCGTQIPNLVAVEKTARVRTDNNAAGYARCHECHAFVEIELDQCPGCRHTICEICPRNVHAQKGTLSCARDAQTSATSSGGKASRKPEDMVGHFHTMDVMSSGESREELHEPHAIHGNLTDELSNLTTRRSSSVLEVDAVRSMPAITISNCESPHSTILAESNKAPYIVYTLESYEDELLNSNHISPSDSDGELSFTGELYSEEEFFAENEQYAQTEKHFVQEEASSLVTAYLASQNLRDRPFRLCPGPGTASTSSLSSLGEQMLTSQKTPLQRRLLGKRDRQPQEDGDNEEDEDFGKGRKACPPLWTRKCEKVFACPYSKYDFTRYSHCNSEETQHRHCASSYSLTIARLKQHLYRVHKRPEHNCPRCYTEYRSRDLLDDHGSSPVSCSNSSSPFEEKMTHDQATTIKRRHRWQIATAAGYFIYATLFPDSQLPPTPYAEGFSPQTPNSLHQIFSTHGDLLHQYYTSQVVQQIPSLDRTQINILNTIFESCFTVQLPAQEEVTTANAPLGGNEESHG